MPDPDLPIPNLCLQPLAVDFIDNHLPLYHPFFANPPVRYDRPSGRYVAIQGPGDMAAATAQASPSRLIPGRPEDKPINRMNFWDDMFAPARAKFKVTVEAPEKRSETGFDIREENTWDGMYEKLRLARAQYTDKTGLGGFLKRVCRKVTDNTQILRGIIQFVPDIDYVTPVLGAVEIILEAMKTAAEVRNRALEGFADLQSTFSNIELFSVIWPDDAHIQESSVTLIVATMAAIELTIGFFTQPGWKKGGKAILKGGGYEDQLIEGFDAIKACRDALLQEAEKSHMNETHNTFREILANSTKLDELQKSNLAAEINANKDRIRRLEEQSSRAPSPHPQSPFALPPPTLQLQVINLPYFSPEILWRMLDMPDLEAADLKYVDSKRMIVPAEDRGRIEVLAQTKKFKDWIGLLTSTRLLIHGDLGMKSTTALSVFCATLAQALSGRARMVTLVWFCGRHARPRDKTYAGGAAMIRSLTAQLLCQQRLDTRLMLRDIHFNPALVRARDIRQLIVLFGWLVRQVPEDVTLFFLVDGISFYERPEFRDGMADVLASIAHLSMDESVAATIKLLVMSPVATKDVRCAFNDDDLILSMQGLTERGEGTGLARLRGTMGRTLRELDDESSDEGSLDGFDDEESELDSGGESSENSASEGDFESDTASSGSD
ncbi:hypothetical protein B0T24DRAFT_680811 [Lasiosphaeria ovina]|uniref:Nephrocystin 3-like N-terminal domain-containing protein n=1 Tax=Lasiosphaeria ovina TaxID=92902 RepID=A0AAE0K831_9PEZI|nr:hypothetical protein B0T24DRAFT_680811 [Lasiosphaeria ovina]